MTMKKAAVIFMLSCIMLQPVFVHAHDAFRIYRNPRFGYLVHLPVNWKSRIYDLSYKHIIVLTRGNYGEIKIRVVKSDKKELKKWENWEDWYLDRIGFKFTKIIETMDISIDENLKGKLILIEYTTRGVRVLQRILITRYDNKILTIECRAPLSSYSRYTDTFNVVMGGLKIGDVENYKPFFAE